MSENIGKTLREQNMAKFEKNKPVVPNSHVNNPATKSIGNNGNDYYSKQSNTERAGRVFNEEGLIESPFKSDHFNSKLLGFDLGEVMGAHNEQRGYTDVFNPNIDFEALRAENQSAFTKMGGLATQFTGKTAVSVVGNIIGTVYGMGEWAMSDEGSISSIFDNDVTRTLDGVTESIEAKNTIFVNSKDGIGFNFNTVKGVSDAFSFIAGAVITEGVMQTVGNALGGAGVATTGLRALRYSKQLGKILKGLNKAEDLEKLALKLGMTVDKMSELKRISDFTAASTGFARRALTNTGYEAGLEARQAKDELIADMTEEMEYYIENSNMSEEETQKYRERKSQEIAEAGDTAGMTTFSLNTGLLAVSNAMQFPTIFGSSYLKKQTLGSLVRKGLGTVGKKEGKRASIGRTVGMFGRVLKNPATEFMEETMQGVFSNYSQNQYEVIMGDRTQAGILAPQANNIADSAYNAIVETYGSKEGLHEGIIGAIVGAIGVPGLKKHGKGYKLHVNGGIAESVRDERQRRQDIENAMDTLNGMKMSDVLANNKSNATRAAVDGQNEDLALATNNKVEFESLRDNKTFRYTVDRMEKGMEGMIDEDVAELQGLADNDLEKYKTLFNKDDNFTKEDAREEVADFKKKSDTYKKAYQTVHKRYNLNLLRGDHVTKKLTDTLTYAVATEKIYTDRLDDLKNNIFNMLHGQLTSDGREFTPEEITNFTNASGKVAKGKHVIDNYIARKNAEKRQRPLTAPQARKRAKIMERISDEHRHLLYRSDKEIEQELRKIDDSELNDKEKAAQKKSIKNIQKAKNEFKEFNEVVRESKKFDADKSYKVSELESELDAIVKDVNQEIAKNTSESLKSISTPFKGITRSELRDYLKAKKEIVDGISKEYDTMSVMQLSEQQHDNVTEMIDEMHELTDRLTTAVNVASYLYGFRNNPGEAYARVVESQFQADMENATRISSYLDLLKTEEPSDEFKNMLTEYKEIIAAMEDELDEATKYFSKEATSGIRKQFNVLKNKINGYNKFLNITDDLEAQRQEAVENAAKKTNPKVEPDEDPDGAFEDSLAGSGAVDKDGEPIKVTSGNETETVDSDGETGGAKTKKPKVARTKNENRLSIRENSAFNKKVPKFQKMLTNGELKNKAATTLKLLENEITPELNPGLHKVLLQEPAIAAIQEDRYEALINAEMNLPELTSAERSELIKNIHDIQNKRITEVKDGAFDSSDTSAYDAYNRGLEKVQADPKLLRKNAKEMDEDVLMFVRYAPIKMDVYDKVLSAENDYEFDITDQDTSVYDQYLFLADDLTKSNQHDVIMEAKYLDAIEELYEQEVLDLKEAGKSKDDTQARVKSEYKKKRADLEARYKASFNNASTNFKFRQLLLQNALGSKKENLLKLKIHNVDQGDFQVFNFTQADPVEEYSVEDLGFTVDNMTEDDIYYVNQSGAYRRIDGKDLDELDNHPFADMKTGLNGKLFFKYKDLSGREVPIKMNTSKLKLDHMKAIRKAVKGFLEAENKLTYKVTNSGIPFLDRKGKNLEEFLSFFLRTKGNFKGKHVIYLNNTFKVNMPKDDPDSSTVRFYTGEADTLEIKSPEALEELGEQFFEELSNTRFTINKDFLAPDGKLDKEVLAYYIDNKIINHPFNTAENFDNIYKPDYNKGVVISLHDTPDTEWERVGSTYDSDIKELRNTLAGSGYNRKNKYGEPDLRTLNHVLMNSIMASMRNQAKRTPADKDLTDSELMEMAKKGVNNVTASRIADIMKVAEKYPNHWNTTHNHETDYVIDSANDSEIDKYLKTIYVLKKDIMSNKKFLKQAAIEYKTWGAKTRLLDKFQDLDKTETKRFHINRYHNRKDNEIETQLTDKKQFESVMEMASVMEELTEMEQYGTGYIHVNYSDDFIENKSKPFNHRVVDQSGTKAQRTGAMYRTRLTSVTVKGNPRWDDDGKRVVGGNVMLNFRNWENGKERGKQVYLFANEDAEPHERLKINILTSIQLPFMDVDFTIQRDALNKERALIGERKRTRDRNIKSILTETKKALKIKSEEDLFSIRNAQNKVTDSQADKWDDTDDDEFDTQLAQSGAQVSDDGSGTTGMGSDLSSYMADTEINQDMRNFTNMAVGMYDPENNSIDNERRLSFVEIYKQYNIESGEKLIQIYDMYKSEGVVENTSKIHKFAEFVFNTTIDCN